MDSSENSVDDNPDEREDIRMDGEEHLHGNDLNYGNNDENDENDGDDASQASEHQYEQQENATEDRDATLTGGPQARPVGSPSLGDSASAEPRAEWGSGPRPSHAPPAGRPRSSSLAEARPHRGSVMDRTADRGVAAGHPNQVDAVDLPDVVTSSRGRDTSTPRIYSPPTVGAAPGKAIHPWMAIPW